MKQLTYAQKVLCSGIHMTYNDARNGALDLDLSPVSVKVYGTCEGGNLPCSSGFEFP